MNVPLGVLTAVFLLIMVRQIGPIRLQIWQIMAGGALVVLLTGSIGPADAARAIDLDVMVFRAGIPLTVVQVLIYWVCLRFL